MIVSQSNTTGSGSARGADDDVDDDDGDSGDGSGGITDDGGTDDDS